MHHQDYPAPAVNVIYVEKPVDWQRDTTRAPQRPAAVVAMAEKECCAFRGRWCLNGVCARFLCFLRWGGAWARFWFWFIWLYRLWFMGWFWASPAALSPCRLLFSLQQDCDLVRSEFFGGLGTGFFLVRLKLRTRQVVSWAAPAHCDAQETCSRQEVPHSEWWHPKHPTLVKIRVGP